MQKYFVYARKSSDSEDRQVLSIEAQLEELKIFIKSLDEEVHIVKEYTEAKTAKDPGRAIFNNMIQRIEKGEAEGIISWHPDRLARNSIDGGKIIHLIDKGLIKDLKFPTYRFDSSAQGKFMLNIIFGQSKYYVDNLSENIKRGIRQKMRRGEFSGRAAIGYINNYKTRNIEIDPDYGPKVRRLFEEYSLGDKKFVDIMRLADSISLLNKKSGKSLTIHCIQHILENPVYCGFLKHKGELHEGRFEPLISKDLFYKVQEVFKCKKRPKITRHKFPFLGLMKCSSCGSMITAEKQKGHHYYRCVKKKGKCDLKYLREEELVNQINKRLAKVCLSNDIQNYFRAKLQEERKNLVKETGTEQNTLYKKLNALELQMSRLMDIYLEGAISKYEYCKKKQKQFEQKHNLQKQISFIEKGQFLWLEHLEDFINSLNKVKKMLETENLEEKRKFLENIGSNFSLGHFGRQVQTPPSVSAKNGTAGQSEAKSARGRGAPLNTGQKATKTVQSKPDSPFLDFKFNDFWEILAKGNSGKTAAFQKSEVWWR